MKENEREKFKGCQGQGYEPGLGARARVPKPKFILSVVLRAAKHSFSQGSEEIRENERQ